MKPLQKRLIGEMRSKGITYAAIAAELGISENTIKSHCRRNKIEVEKPDVCPVCSKPLVHLPHKKKKRFCSDKCRMAWWKKNPESVNRKANYDFVCPTCQKPFTSYGNPKRIYCSRKCSARRNTSDV